MDVLSMKLYEYNMERNSNCSSYVAWWNTWDHEHLYYVHGQFRNSKILSESNESVVILTQYQLPFIKIKIKGFHCMFNISNSHCRVIDYLPFGLEVITDILFHEVSKENCIIKNRYRIYGCFLFFLPIKLFMKYFIDQWNETNWQ